jgi:predicted permease
VFLRREGSDPQPLKQVNVTGNLFHVLGAAPLIGRTFTDEETFAGNDRVVVLSHGLWQALFAADPGVIGRSIVLSGRSCTIIGVMPRGFFFPARDAQLWAPGGYKPAIFSEMRRPHYLRAIARLKPGVSLEQANAEAATVFDSMIDSFIATHPDAQRPLYRYGVAPFQASISRDARPALLMMLGAVGMLLLIACANTANLLLARASGRGREIAVRAALGAGRARIIRQLLTESVILFVIGGTLGVLLAYWSVPVLLKLTPSSYTVYQDVTVNLRVLGAMVLLSTYALGVHWIGDVVAGAALGTVIAR